MKKMKPAHFPSAAVCSFAAVLMLASPAFGATITLVAEDGFGTTSFNTGENWSDGLAPSAGNDYVTGEFRVRTPPDGGSYTFAGDSLTVNNTNGYSWGLMYKGTGSDGVITIDNLILDGGMISHANGPGDVCQLDGAINVVSDSQIYAKQGAIEVLAVVTGAATITNPGADDTGRTLRFHNAANTFTGSIINNGEFELVSGGVLNFVIGGPGVNNSVTGTGSAVFDGAFNVDLTNASTTSGVTWIIANVATQSFGDNFTVNGFTEGATGVWTSGNYRFDEATGILSFGDPAGTWDGDASNLWSVAANWSADTLPTFTGFANTLTFASTGASGGTLNNDVSGVQVQSLIYTEDAAAFTMSGNAIELSTAVTNNSSNTQTVNLDITATGNVNLAAIGAPLLMNGLLSSIDGFVKGGDETLTLSNGSNSIIGDVTYTGAGNIILTASDALGDPNARVLLNASFQGGMGGIEFSGGVSQTKWYDIYTRTEEQPAHFIASSGVNTVGGLITNVSGGTYINVQVDAGATLNLDAEWDSSNGLGYDIIRVVGDGTLNVNGLITDLEGQEIGINKAEGGSGVVNVNGANTLSGDLVAVVGTIALVDASSNNNVPSADLQAQAAGTLDFSGLLGGGIALASGQTLSGDGNFVGAVTAGSGSIINPGVDGVGTMNLASLTLEDGAQINIDADSNFNDLLNINGLLTGPSSGTVLISPNFAGGISVGSFVVLDWSTGAASGVNLSDFTASIGSLSIAGSQLILTITIDELADVLVSDSGNSRVLKFNVSQFGAWAADATQPVFAEGTVGDYPLENPVGLAQDSLGNVYIAEGLTDLQDRVLKFDSDGNYLATVAEIDSFDANLVFSGTPAHIVVDPTDSYLFMSVPQANSTATDPNLEDVIWRVDLSGATAPVIYIDSTDPNGNYILQDPQGLEFGPDGYLYVSNNLPDDANLPNPGSRVLRFDVSGSTGVYAGSLTDQRSGATGMFYDGVLQRLLVNVNVEMDIWAYTDLTLDLVPAHQAVGWEAVYDHGSTVTFPDVVTAVGMIFFTNATDNSIGMVNALDNATDALSAAAGLSSPHSMLVLSEFNAFDFDNDGDVDGADLGVMEFAINGPDVDTPPVTVTQNVFNRADIDKDADVDMEDLLVMQQQAN